MSPELQDEVKWFHLGMMEKFQEDETYALMIGELMGDAATDVIEMVRNYLNASHVI